MIHDDYERPIGPWPRKMHPPGSAHQITPDELRSWIVYEDERLFVVNKPADVVCHPSKEGPWSSLCGAVREYLGLETIHLVFRLDRETSGLVILGKDADTGSRLQTAAQRRQYGKTYLALLSGELRGETLVDQPLGPDYSGPVAVKSCVCEGGQRAVTRFIPLAAAGGFTLVRVKTETGRKHQIRAHAQWLGYPMVGDKIYGPDQRLFLEFIDFGWSAAMAERLLLPRQALHCGEISVRLNGTPLEFRAPLPEDMRAFVGQRMHLVLPEPYFGDGALVGSA